jgi:fumarylacetoacetase
MGHQIVVAPESPFTVDNIPFGVVRTTKDSTPRCASAIGDYAIDLSLYAQWGNLDSVKEDVDLAEVFSQVCFNRHGSLNSVRQTTSLGRTCLILS